MMPNWFIRMFFIVALNIWLGNGLEPIHDDEENRTDLCHHKMTLIQIVELLNQKPCVQLIQKDNHRIVKRNPDAGNFDIHALQTTINDHRTMINYLINNSMNATFIADAINNHHSKTGPVLTSWRDLIDLFTVTFFIGFLIYYGLCRTGCKPFDQLLSFCCKPVITRIQNQEHEQRPANVNEQPPRAMQHQRRRRRPPPQLQASIASIEQDIGRYHNGYMSE